MKLFIYPPTPISVSVPPIAFTIDGVPTPVNIDTSDPSQSTPLPVASLNPDGSEVDFSLLAKESKQDDILAQLVDIEANQVTGLGTLNDISTKTDDVLTQLESIAEDVSDAATNTTLEEVVTQLETLNSVDFATAANQATGNGLIQDLITIQGPSYNKLVEIDTELENLNAKDFATSAKQDDIITAIEDVKTGLATELKQDDSIAEEVKINTVLGTQADAAAVNTTSPNSMISLLKGQMALLNAIFSNAVSTMISSETAVVSDSVVKTFTKPSNATKMMIINNPDSTNANPVRWTPNAEAPTSSNGAMIVPTAPAPIMSANEVKVIAVGGSGNVTVVWFT